MSLFLLSQIVGGIAFVCDCITFQVKERIDILKWSIVAASLLVVHFLLLESFFSAGVVFLALLRLIVAYFTFYIVWAYVFSGLNILLFLLIGDYSFVSYLGLIAGFFFAFAVFREDDRNLRLLTMCGTSFWLAHVFFVWSPIAIFIEISMLTSNIIGYWRYYIRKT